MTVFAVGVPSGKLTFAGVAGVATVAVLLHLFMLVETPLPPGADDGVGMAALSSDVVDSHSSEPR